MSNPQDNLTEQLGRELHDRGASVHGQPIGLGDVKKTAGKIRRRRQVAGGAVVAAAAAILVPSVMVAGNLLGGDAAPQPANPSPSVTQTPKPADGPIVLDADAPQGADPQMQYLDGRKLVDSAGNVVPLSADYSGLARVGNEYLAVRQGDPGTFVDVLDSEGKVIDTVGDRRGRGQLGRPDGRRLDHARWPDHDPVPGRHRAAGHDRGSAQAVEILGSGSCMEDKGGCRVFFNHVRRGRLPPGPPTPTASWTSFGGDFSGTSGRSRPTA